MRVVVVTGVSRGLGEALVDELLADEQTRVVALGRRFTERQRARGDRLRLVGADLADPACLPPREALAAALDGCTEAALVHNAAVVGPIGPIGELPADEIARAVTVNLTAPMLLTNAFLAAVPPTAQHVDVLFVSSGAAGRPIEGWATYCATKSGGEAFFAVAAQEADARVRVASVNPGVMDTDMQATLRDSRFPSRDRYVGLHERGELPSPTEVARRIVAEHLTRE
jgi:NAD(P)-dependent dehydrogenase (short-subunit alcohol dehydrogenase family)